MEEQKERTVDDISAHFHKLDFTYQQYKQNGHSLNNLKIGPYIVKQRLINQGAQSKVFNGINTQTNTGVFIKLLDLKNLRQLPQGFEKQKKTNFAKTQPIIMYALKSDHIVKLFDVYENNDLKIMVMEYCNGGTLSDYIYDKIRIPEHRAINFLKQLLLGLNEMHKNNIIHRDLKSDNIVINNQMIKIADLGFARYLPEANDLINTFPGTRVYMAPEILAKQQYGPKADIWSLGVIFYEMVYGKRPYQNQATYQAMLTQIKTRRIFPKPNQKINGITISPKVQQLLKLMLTINQTQRIHWRQLICHDTFNDSDISQQKFYPRYSLAPIRNNHYSEITENTEQHFYSRIQTLCSQIQQNSNQPSSRIRPQYYSTAQLRRTQQQHNYDYKNMRPRAQVQKYFLDFRKAQWIIKSIIHPIEQNKILDLDDKHDLQFMYLLCARSFIYLSFVRDRTCGKNQLVRNLAENIQGMYVQAKRLFDKYQRELYRQQWKIPTILYQKLFMKKQDKRIREIFFSGNQDQNNNQSNLQRYRTSSTTQTQSLSQIGYSKQQQIQFTYSEYMLPYFEKLRKKQEKKTISEEERKLAKCLRIYKKVNVLSISSRKSFEDVLRESELSR